MLQIATVVLKCSRAHATALLSTRAIAVQAGLPFAGRPAPLALVFDGRRA